MVIDELYTKIGQRKAYVWAAYAKTRAGLVKRFFHLGWTKGNEDLERFLEKLPRAGEYFADENGCYKSVLGSRVTCEKNEMTNKIEGTNGVLRRKLSRLRRKTQAGSKSYTWLEEHLALIFLAKNYI